MAKTRPVFKQQRFKKNATTEPKSRLGDLKGYWARDIDVYKMLVVRVKALRGSLLSFSPINPDTGEEHAKSFSVDLEDGKSVFGDLPSTAQLVDTRSAATVAYLLLSVKWTKKNLGKDFIVYGDPPKIPKNLELP